MSTTRILTFLAALTIAGTGLAGVVVTDRSQTEFPIHASGVVVIKNRVGDIHVTVSDEPKLSIKADRVIRAADESIVVEARQIVQRIVEGNEKMRVIRTVQPSADNGRWNAQVNLTIVMPRTASLRILSQRTGGIRVNGVRGAVSINNYTGPVLLENLSGPVTVENTNGDVTLVSETAIGSNVQLVSVNGSIAVRAPQDANFIWDVETLMGEARTSYPVRGGRFLTPTRFRGNVNAPTNVTITTQTVAGNVVVLPTGGNVAAAQNVRGLVRQIVLPTGVGPSLPPTAANRGALRRQLVPNSFRHATSIGDVRIEEIRGTAEIATGAGEVNLGSVFGHCNVSSGGGPLILGEITGRLGASTLGGNVTVQRAREGGIIHTGGGTIVVQYAGGPVQLTSGGGDIVLNQALGSVIAETRSGDIAVTMRNGVRGERIDAKTGKGNVVLTLPPDFAADVDAVVLTSNPAANQVRSDIPGLVMQRDQVNGKTRIRARGKINGGGPRVQIEAHDGGIHIAVDAPRVSPTVRR